MKALTLEQAARAVAHSHKGMDHEQEGNPFYAWWDDCRFRCDLCLALMAASDQDIALAFAQEIPYRIERHNLHLNRASRGYDYEARWWKETYLAVLKYVPDLEDREWMRIRLADALSRGMRDRARKSDLTT